MTVTYGMFYGASPAALEISHASVQVLGGTSQKGAHVVPSRRTKLDGDKGWNRILKEQGGALLFFCLRSTQPMVRRGWPKTSCATPRRFIFKSQWPSAPK